MALGGCASTSPVEPGMAQSVPDRALGQQIFNDAVPEAYTLRPADVIDIRVFREEQLSLAAVPVSAMGQISMPLVGAVSVAGLTPAQAEAELERLLATRYLRDPDVTVNVVRYASHIVTVEGSVETPGVYEFIPGTRLSGGIAMAEGPARTANVREVAVIRLTPQGRQIAKFDYRAMQEGAMLDPVLQAGDRVIVGTDGLAVFWQDLLRALPAFGIFTQF